jgi:hypothetical protein
VRRRCALVCVLLGLIVALPAPGAGARDRSAARRLSPAVVHLHWKLATQKFAALMSSGQYLFLWTLARPGREGGPPLGASSGVVVDAASGTRTPLSFPPGCSPGAMGGSWLAFGCSAGAGQPVPPAELYDLTSGRWQPLAVNPAINFCTYEQRCTLSPAAIGTQWVEWSVSIACEHCAPFAWFQNLSTGALNKFRAWKAGGTLIPDLDSPSLAAKLCRPLHVPRPSFPPTGSVPNPLTFYGQFAVVGAAPIPSPSAPHYFERCGSRRRHPIASPPIVGSPRFIMWPTAPTFRKLEGVFLPSLRPFVSRPPSRMGFPVHMALASNRLYVLDSTGRLWSTNSTALTR